MRRRRLLALSTVAVGFAGYEWYTGSAADGDENTTSTPTETANRTSIATANRTSTEAKKTPTVAKTPSIGGSLNGRPHRLSDNPALVEKSNTRWMHAFLDVREKYEQDVTPRADPDITTLRRISQEMGTTLIVSLQWNFTGIFGEKEAKNVPPSGSPREEALFEYATKLLTAIDHPVDTVLLGNEPIWETPDEDVKGSDAPLIPFTRRLKDHLVHHYTAGDPRFLLGSFNRLYDDYVRKEYQHFYRQLFEMARNDDDIDGIDLHVHYDDFQEAETMLAAARKEIPDGTITVTEFSPVWRYDRNKDRAINEFEGGGQFADRHGLPGDMTVLEYFEAAKDDPRSHDEMADFMETMPWYNVSFVEDMYDLLNAYDVDVGAFGFLQDVGIRHTDWTEEWRPFQINYLFQRGLIATEDGAHPHYFDDYRRRT